MKIKKIEQEQQLYIALRKLFKLMIKVIIIKVAVVTELFVQRVMLSHLQYQELIILLLENKITLAR
ncbi:MAG TPA: hypothetical protein VKA91_01520 [Nitrososphaeraceae archaeon]|nr:hypothetical protein [Nitrososphaeraceae archaeon]